MTSERLLTITKKIIRGAAAVGLEEAGVRIAGPTLWRFIKVGIEPVFRELETRFPKLLLVGETEAKEAAEGAVEALSDDEGLQLMLLEALSGLEDGQERILAMLAQQDDTLQGIGASIDRGLKEAGEQHEAASEKILTEIQALNLKLEGVRGLVGGDAGPRQDYAELSIDEIYKQANAYQHDAMKWVVARDSDLASQRLAQGRDLLETGLNREPENADLLVSLGYIEKTQAQISVIEGDYDASVTILGEAAKYFAKGLEHDPSNVSSINGMANIYFFARDYDRAIQIGMLVFRLAPTYGAAIWDLSLALEGKIKEVGDEPPYVDMLKSIYEYLEKLMPQLPQQFPATNLAHVQKRLAELKTVSSD
jgi:tetratricopeptide (TPR) repeat protein